MLTEIFPRYQAVDHVQMHGDKGSNHSYIPIYEELMQPMLKMDQPKLMEIGVAAGLSLSMWREFLGDKATIVGCDISGEWLPDKYNFDFFKGWSQHPTTRRQLEKYGQFDFIIDDGDHNGNTQVATWYNIWPLLKEGGIYVVEDVANIGYMHEQFEALHKSCTIHDLRKVKGRRDDVLIVYTK